MYLLYIKIMKLKTFIKWSGNKSKHLRHLIPHVPKDFNTYIEPFVGSGSLLLAISWIINDINKDLVNSWIQLQKNPGEILDFFNEFSGVFKPQFQSRIKF
jgi:DNA adenine methylase